MTYVIIDPKKREHHAADYAAVDRIIAELKKTFGDGMKFKIRAVVQTGGARD